MKFIKLSLMKIYKCTGYDPEGQPVYEDETTGEETTPEALIEQGAPQPLGDIVVIEESGVVSSPEGLIEKWAQLPLDNIVVVD